MSSKILKIPGIDIWSGFNQPYGYWRLGNPILKLIIIFLLIYSFVIADYGLMIQIIALILIILYMPYDESSKISMFFMSFGFGGLIIGLLSPIFIHFNKYEIKSEIKNIATIDIFRVIMAALLIIIFFLISKAFTSRDYAWLIDLFKWKSLRLKLALYFHSYCYTLLRGHTVLQKVDISLRTRGILRPTKIFSHSEKSIDIFIDIFGLWLLNLFAYSRKIEKTIIFVLVSRYNVYERQTPLWRKWSPNDISILGVLLLTVLFPRIYSYLKSI